MCVPVPTRQSWQDFTESGVGYYSRNLYKPTEERPCSRTRRALSVNIWNLTSSSVFRVEGSVKGTEPQKCQTRDMRQTLSELNSSERQTEVALFTSV